MTDQEFKPLRKLSNLNDLCLLWTSMTDDALGDFEQLTGLSALMIGRTKMSWSKFAQLKSVKNLERLFIFGISDEEKCSLIKGSLAVVFVSTQEGYGLPIIEAHAAHRRVITSRRRPMSDIAAGDDLLVSPSDESELIAAYRALAQRSDRFSPAGPDPEVSTNQFRIIENLLR
jgi:hypothetical protein